MTSTEVARPENRAAISPAKGVSPYLRDDKRLADVIAAIQVMATYKFYKLDFAGWASRISADELRASHWQQVFHEHPEFFRFDGERNKASLVWRRQYPRRYHVDLSRVLTEDEYKAITPEAYTRLSRVPLSPDDIRALIGTAIDLHQRALDAQKERRWWLPLASALGGLVGSIAGALIGALFRQP